MNILITGGLGFVGRHFARRLIDDGNTVTIVDDMSNGVLPEHWAFKAQWKPFGLYLDDARDFFASRKDPSIYDLVIHCAAVVGGREKIEGRPLAVADNLGIDSSFFNWVTRAPNKTKFIYFSSSAVYPVALQTRKLNCALSEKMVDFDSARLSLPDATYGWCKLTGEYLALHAVRNHCLDVVIYRPFSGYGEDQDLSYPFPSIIQRVAERQDPVTVWGSGEQVRDWIHIDDIVEGVLSTMTRLKPGTAMNLGSGVGTSFKDLLTKVCAEAQHAGEYQPLPDRPSGVFSRVADTYFMSDYFTPKVSLDEGIRRSLAFAQKRVDSDAVSV